MKLLVTGATGYIGSHFVELAAEHGHDVTGTDFNMDQNEITKFCSEVIPWDFRRLPEDVHADYDKVVHLGAANSVPKSVNDPWLYYETNVVGTRNVIEYANCDHFIYCSTGSAFDPISSPYANTKYGGELITQQFNEKCNIVRFYNVSGNNGFFKFDDEYSHLIRKAAAVANGMFDKLYVYGTDYDTRDGTTIRNYAHVTDIVESLIKITNNEPTGVIDCLGVPAGNSVKEVIDTMRSVSNTQFEVVEGPRREGDIAVSTVPYASEYFKQTKTLEQMCYDALNHEGI